MTVSRALKEKGSGAVLFLAAIFLLLSSTATAAEAMKLPSGMQELGRITAEKSVLYTPGQLTVGGDGTLYVVDGYRHHVLKFSREGTYLGDIRIQQPSAVAVAPDGTLYIGSHKDYSVAIYRNGKFSGYLGSGPGEFRSIRDIAVDGGKGDVYVVDNLDNVVKAYSSSGKPLFVIDNLLLPIGVAVKKGKIYVLDAPERFDPEGRSTTGARIVVFDRAGTILDEFESDGESEGRMVKPTDVDADGSGNIYFSDALSSTVMVLDASGQKIGEIKGSGAELQVPVSLAVSDDGRLFVSSSENRSIFVIGTWPGLR